MDDPPIFEKTYPKYEFSALVRMAIALSAWIAGIRRRARARRRKASSARTTGEGRRAI